MALHTYVMEEVSKASSTSTAARPALSFILGTALVVCIVLVVTTVFLCAYHWTKLLKEAAAQQQQELLIHTMQDEVPGYAHQKVVIVQLDPMPREVPVVYMPGHAMPTFIAMPSPFPCRQHDGSGTRDDAMPILQEEPQPQYDEKLEISITIA